MSSTTQSQNSQPRRAVRESPLRSPSVHTSGNQGSTAALLSPQASVQDYMRKVTELRNENEELKRRLHYLENVAGNRPQRRASAEIQEGDAEHGGDPSHSRGEGDHEKERLRSRIDEILRQKDETENELLRQISQLQSGASGQESERVEALKQENERLKRQCRDMAWSLKELEGQAELEEDVPSAAAGTDEVENAPERVASDAEAPTYQWADVQHSMQQMESDMEELRSQLEEERAEKERSRQTVDRKENELQSSKENAAEAQRKSLQLEEELEGMRRRVEELEKAVAEKDDAVNDEKQRVIEVEREKEQLQKRIREREEELTRQLVDREATVEDKLQEEVQKRQEAEERAETLESKLQSESERIQEQVRSLENELRQKQQVMTRLENDLHARQRQNDELQHRLNEVATEKEKNDRRAQQDAERLLNEKQSAEKEVERLQERVKAAEQALEEERERRHNVEQQANGANDERSQLAKQAEEMERKLEEERQLRVEVENIAESSASRWQDELERLQNKVNEEEEASQLLKRKLDSSEAENQRLHERLEDSLSECERAKQAAEEREEQLQSEKAEWVQEAESQRRRAEEASARNIEVEQQKEAKRQVEEAGAAEANVLRMQLEEAERRANAAETRIGESDREVESAKSELRSALLQWQGEDVGDMDLLVLAKMCRRDFLRAIQGRETARRDATAAHDEAARATQRLTENEKTLHHEKALKEDMITFWATEKATTLRAHMVLASEPGVGEERPFVQMSEEAARSELARWAEGRCPASLEEKLLKAVREGAGEELAALAGWTKKEARRQQETAAFLEGLLDAAERGCKGQGPVAVGENSDSELLSLYVQGLEEARRTKEAFAQTVSSVGTQTAENGRISRGCQAGAGLKAAEEVARSMQHLRERVESVVSERASQEATGRRTAKNLTSGLQAAEQRLNERFTSLGSLCQHIRQIQREAEWSSYPLEPE